MTLKEIAKLPPIALHDLALGMAQAGRCRYEAIHFGAILHRFKRERLFLRYAEKLKYYYRDIIDARPKNMYSPYISVFLRCRNLGLTEEEVCKIESLTNLRTLSIWTRVAVSREELFEFTTWKQCSHRYTEKRTYNDLGRVLLLEEQRKAFSAPKGPLSGLRFNKKQAERLDETLSFFRVQYGLTKAQSISAMCCLVTALRSAAYGERIARMRQSLLLCNLPPSIAQEICPP